LIASIVAKLLGSVGFGFLDRVLGHLEKRADSEIEKAKVAAAREKASQELAAHVVTTGMQHRAFWIPWLIAAVPTSLWFGWGMLDSLANGSLPNVAALPPQLKEYADIVFGNIFYSGAALGSAQLLAGAIRRR
jgi:hypothetical protein